MNIDANLPLSLHKANVALWLRTTQLLQESGQLWLERGSQVVDDNLEEARSCVDQLRESEDWQALAALPGRVAWRVLSQQVGSLQAAAETTLSVQMAFASGWQQALATWQKESAHALTRADDAMPIQTSLRALLRGWSGLSEAPTAPAGRY